MARVKVYTARWQGRKITEGFKGWACILGVLESNFHLLRSRYDTFQDFVDAYQPNDWEVRNKFLYGR